MPPRPRTPVKQKPKGILGQVAAGVGQAVRNVRNVGRTVAPARPKPKPRPAAPTPRPAAAAPSQPYVPTGENVGELLQFLAAQQPPPVARSGEGLFWDPIRGSQAPPAPPPTFEAQGTDPLGAGIDAEIARLNAEQTQAARGQMDVNARRIQEDLAARLADLQTQRTQAREDQQRQETEVRRELPGALERTRTGFSASGLEFGGQKARAVGEVQTEADQQIRAGQTALARGEQEAETLAQRAEREASRAREDLERSRADFERRVREGELKGRAQIARAHAESQRGEARSWVKARYNELLIAGQDPTQARSMAIADARGAYPGVGDTWIVGAFAPTKEAKPVRPYAIAKLGVPISVERAEKIGPRKTQELRLRPQYLGGAAAVDEFARQFGRRPTADEFLRYYQTVYLPDRNPNMKPKQIAGELRKGAHILSVLFADRGIL